ncbi:hypothetical protein HK100_007180, partial [Physocladia obscura]
MKQLFRRISNIGGGARNNSSNSTIKVNNGSSGQSAPQNNPFGVPIDALPMMDLEPQRRHPNYRNLQQPQISVTLHTFILYLSSEQAGKMDFSRLDSFEGIHIVASVFKQWIRDIPDGVVPKKYFQSFLDCGGSSSKLQLVFQTLPPANQSFLIHLLEFLIKVAFHSAENLMSTQNLVIVFAPNVFRCPSAAPAATGATGIWNPEKYLIESMQVTKIMAHLLENFCILFAEAELLTHHSRSSKKSVSTLIPPNQSSPKELDSMPHSNETIAEAVSITSGKLQNAEYQHNSAISIPRNQESQREIIKYAIKKT